MLYMGTLVTSGHGDAVAVATGRFTEMAKIQLLIGETESPETPIERQLTTIGRQLVVISAAVCGLVFIVGMWRGYGVLQMLKASISLAVAAVPEGLPTIATTTLAIGIHRLRQQHVLIRKLNAVETLGCVETICLDKTGTLTENRMKVMAIFSGMKRMQVMDEAVMWNGHPVDPFQHDELLRLLHVGVLCSEVEIEREGGAYILHGSPTETALIHTAILAGVDPVQVRAQHPLMAKRLRAESRNFMCTVHQTPGGGHPLVLVKGSPSEVLQLCRWHIKDGAQLALTDDDIKAIDIENDHLGGHAMRVLGTAYGFANDTALDTTDDTQLIWLGLFGMADPIRDGIKDVIGQFQGAGIDTIMITGDQSPTAYAIGKELNLAKDEPLRILDSTHLAALSGEAMVALAGKVDVYARVSPASKLQIVQAIQRAGKVVAMTGDGINDGPALKAADIGIAMGRSGTDVAREVADVVIEDDALATMIVAVSQGRTIYNNIRKSVHFLLATNMSEIIVMFVAIAGGLGQPLSAMQLLWINLMSDIAPGLALALEPPEPDVLTRPPRHRDEPILSTSDFSRMAFEATALSAGALAAYGYGLLRYGAGAQASTLCFTSLTVGQLLHAVSCRSERHSVFEPADRPSNPYLTAALASSLGLQGLTLIVPGWRAFLGLTPISLVDTAVVGGTAVLPFIVNEASKT
jgi:Ca2+-transporting ATPase